MYGKYGKFSISLTDPRLGAELLEDPKGLLPINVWVRYCLQYTRGDDYPVYLWSVDFSSLKRIPPQEAVDMAEPLAYETIQHLKSGSSEKALASVNRAWQILFTGSSDWQRGRGQPASMRLPAVRAYVLRTFCKPAVKWDKVADMLFLKDGKCPRKIRDKAGTCICNVIEHRYDDPCVRNLREAVNRLKAAMKHDGIPV